MALATSTLSSLGVSATGAGGVRVSEHEALIESSYRRLLASIEAERERIRNTWTQIETESGRTSEELEQLTQDTEEWCQAERHKIEMEWKRLDKLRERMSIIFPVNRAEMLDINCSGQIFSIQKSALCSIEDSMLNHMFSDAFVQSIPRDQYGRFFLDFNPHCFGIIVEYLEMRMADPGAEVPPIPTNQQQNMDLLAEVLKLKPFLRENSMLLSHTTSLKVTPNSITATHSGWQVVSARLPIHMSGVAYFEVTVASNPDSKNGGLAIGVCGHVPQGPDTYTIRIPDAVLYNSGNGLVGESIAAENVIKGIHLAEGSIIGVRHDAHTRNLQFYFNGACIGACTLKPEFAEKMQVLYPTFALMTPNQRLQIDFSSSNPRVTRPHTHEGTRDA
mmetsp:Transcript_118833/g.236748  ORF Transcript_118833/g.236748 Transcript_118833/m.236748 type:complete len:390 (+) Transcript_118833:43-1212(+)|eukprot:CAMPEP_0172696096 /NCGR_PEP_ID=MMETSP1074-20121228/27810_1 /TAXON_ID=2916 /ORGANISM="Ceratium fusus, Strain PA161109" /LENGTH=389 /DNA_ID=CAMNT_0013516789 /DNA_START=33 /DNA_END=1202 /DNA_ORIENTATION=-